MTTQTIKDSSSRIIGYIETRYDGVLVLKNAASQIKGYYDPRANVTKNASSQIVGYGNILGTLL